MKKIISLILALVMVAFVAISCAKTETNEENDVNTPVVEGPEVEPEVEPEVTPDVEPEVEPDVTPDVEPEVEPEVQPEVTPDAEPETTPEQPTQDVVDLSTKTAEEIIGLITAIEAPEFMHGVIPVDLSDVDSLNYFTGLDSAEKISDVSVNEALMGSQAYSLVVVKTNDAADAKAVAESMKNGIDQRKWICVEADDIKVSGKGNVVCLIMVDSEYKDVLSAASVTEAFKTVCGGTLDFEI